MIEFQPTRPLRGATYRALAFTVSGYTFQPTRPLRGATIEIIMDGTGSKISTHAPLAGRDLDVKTGRRVDYNFNPRAPCGARP